MTAAQEKLWLKTHSDFKAVFDGKRFIMRDVGSTLKFIPLDELA